MNVKKTTATFGLNAFASPDNTATSGVIQIGSNNQTVRLDEVTKIHSFEFFLAGFNDDIEIDVTDMTKGAGSTAWVAGTAQVETATAAGTVSTSGNLTITVTSAGMTGSPLAVSVPVLNGDTAATWAGKVRTALAANATIAARFTVSGTSTAIVLTRKPTHTATINGETISCYAADDATLNIATANGTAAGITAAATSVSTSAGIATSGAYAPYLNGKDIFGELLGFTSIKGLQIQCLNTSANELKVSTDDGWISDLLVPHQKTIFLQQSDANTITIDAGDNFAKGVITIAGL